MRTFNPISCDDVMLDHPWVEKYRIPVMGSYYPTFFYFVTLTMPEPEAQVDVWHVEEPTEEEAALIGEYIKYRISTFGFYDTYIEKINARQLDVDSGINTISLGKDKTRGWVYRMMTWSMGPATVPDLYSTVRYPSLIDLLSRIEDNNERYPNEKWRAWRKERNL